MASDDTDPLLICAAIRGGAPARSRSPHPPVTFDGIVEEALSCWRSGAAMIHLHARGPDGAPLMSAPAYDALCDAFRTQGCHAERLAIADCRADMISLDIGSFNIRGRL